MWGMGDLEILLETVTQRIVEDIHPLRIVLFGSVARGEVSPNSDIDLLVVVPSGLHRRKTAQRLYRSLLSVGFAVDLVVVTEDDIDQYGTHPGMVISSALKEGRELYAA